MYQLAVTFPYILFAIFALWGGLEGRKVAPKRRAPVLAVAFLALIAAGPFHDWLWRLAGFPLPASEFYLYFGYGGPLSFALIALGLHAVARWGSERVLLGANTSTCDSKPWFSAKKTESGTIFTIEQGVKKRRWNFLWVALGTAVPLLWTVWVLEQGRYMHPVIDVITLIALLVGFLGIIATALGGMPFLASFWAKRFVTIEISPRGVVLNGEEGTLIPRNQIIEIAWQSDNDASAEACEAFDARQSSSTVVVGGTGTLGANIAAASVAAAAAKSAGRTGGAAAVLGLYMVRSGSDCHVNISHSGRRAQVARMLSKEQARFAAQKLAEALWGD